MVNVELFENERASGYDDFVSKWIPNYDYFIQSIPKLIGNTDGDDVLIVGCGTGNEIEYFVQAGNQWNIPGIAQSSEKLQQAREKFRD